MATIELPKFGPAPANDPYLDFVLEQLTHNVYWQEYFRFMGHRTTAAGKTGDIHPFKIKAFEPGSSFPYFLGDSMEAQRKILFALGISPDLYGTAVPNPPRVEIKVWTDFYRYTSFRFP